MQLAGCHGRDAQAAAPSTAARQAKHPIGSATPSQTMYMRPSNTSGSLCIPPQQPERHLQRVTSRLRTLLRGEERREITCGSSPSRIPVQFEHCHVCRYQYGTEYGPATIRNESQRCGHAMLIYKNRRQNTRHRFIHSRPKSQITHTISGNTYRVIN